MENNNKKDKGSSAVEFALILPFLLLILFLIIEFSIAMYDKAVVTNASREGARRGILMADPRVSTAEIRSAVTNYCGSNLISFGTATATTVVDGAPCAATGDYITVTVSYPYNFLVVSNLANQYLKGFTGPLVLNGTAVMRCE